MTVAPGGRVGCIAHGSMRSGLVGFAALIALAAAASVARADDTSTVSIPPAKDNTLFEQKAGITSSGAGLHLYAGKSGFMGGQAVKRPVMMFDIASAVPAGAVITEVTLTLNLVQAGGILDHNFSLHTLLTDWGEGTSVAGGGQGAAATPDDATWLHTYFPNSFWATAGGDYDPSVVASLLVLLKPDFYTWGSTPGMVADVQSWLDSPGTNYGWIMIGNEVEIFSTRKFSSREEEIKSLRPVLTIEYRAAVDECDADLNDDGEVNAADLAALLGTWGPCPGCPEDLTGDDEVNAADLAVLLGGWGPC